MKKYFIFLMLTLSLNTFAREYYQQTGTCNLFVTEQDLFNAERKLPFSLKVDYILGFDRVTSQLLGQRVEVRRLVNATTPVSAVELEKIANSLKFLQTRNQDVKVNVNFDKESITKLFVYAGAYRLTSNGHLISAINLTLDQNKSYRIQRHLAPNNDNGLSYHLIINCSQHSKPAIEDGEDEYELPDSNIDYEEILPPELPKPNIWWW